MLSKVQERKSNQPTRVTTEMAARFAATGYTDLQQICGETKDHVMVLTGTVPSYYLKQVAQTVARNMEGVTHVENRLEV
ncbi:MAG: BON domain-containing protein, partial [Planctomycetaceae bacterium]|nr:BON domain-containing protein [Planctomycetaceae bacterium]